MNSIMNVNFVWPIFSRHVVKRLNSFVNSNKYTRFRYASTGTFDDFIQQQQSRASRSIVVQVQSEKSFSELYNYCCSFGSIVNALHYCIGSNNIEHYILLEYENPEGAAEAIATAATNEDFPHMPVKSPFVWFRTATKRTLNHKPNSKPDNKPKPNLLVIDGNAELNATQLNSVLCEAEDINDQLFKLYENTKLNDLGIRLRFLAANQVEHAVSGMFPLANALPFGSSVNGFGKMGCDLDLILRFTHLSKDSTSSQRNDSRLVLHTKENLTNGRSQTQRQLESFGDMLQLFLPGVYHVRRILQARVPIIKYHHQYLNLEIDLSMTNLSGFYMSELLYIFGEFDDRVRPLVFCIRRWANNCGLTNPSPGRWITNFSLTCLVIFFLQQLKQPILPSINQLMKKPISIDVQPDSLEEFIECQFQRDFQKLNFNRTNRQKIAELLLQFFEFYSKFDFASKAVSLNEGRAISKSDHSPMYIVNPLEPLLNVSKNISQEECERFRIEVRNAAWIFETELDTNDHKGKFQQQQQHSIWGLLKLLKTSERPAIKPTSFFKPRILEVSDLFHESAEDDLMTMQNSQPQPSSEEVVFKNSNIKTQIENIKSVGRKDLKQIYSNIDKGTFSSATNSNSMVTSRPSSTTRTTSTTSTAANTRTSKAIKTEIPLKRSRSHR